MRAKRTEHSFEHSNLEQLIRVERRAWQKSHLLRSLPRYFQKLTDEAFLDLRRKYFVRPI